MEKMKLNIQLFNGSVAIQTITETTDIYTNQSTFTIPAKMTTTGSTYNNSNASMTMQWKYESDSSWTSLNKQTFGIGKSSSKTKSWTLTLTHNNDGTLENVQFRVKWYITDSTNGTTGATTYTPTTIPRGSEFDTLNWNRDTQILLNSTISIPAIQHISLAYHKLEARFMINGNEQVVATWTGISITNGYISFSFTTAQLSTIYNLMPSEITHYIRMYLYTYSDSGYTTQIGEESAIWWTGLIPDNVVPVAHMSYSEGGDTPSSWGVYVKGKSKLNLILTGSGTASSTITSYLIRGDGYTYNSNTALTNYLSTSGNITFTGIVTDSRGRQGSWDVTIYALDYYNPSISTAQVQRCDENGNIDNNGEYLYISYGASISSCGNRNKANAHYKVGYRVQDTGSYQYVDLASNVDSYSATGMLYTDGIYAADRGSGTKVQFSTSNTFDIQFYVDDTFNPNGQTNTQQLDTGFDLMNFNPSGKSMAIGKVSEASASEEKLEIGINTEIDGYIQQFNPNDRLGSNLVLRGTSTYPEASINFANPDGSHTYYVGYGVGGGDWFGVWGGENSRLLTKLDKEGHLTASGEVMGGLNNGYGQFRAPQGNYGFLIRNDGDNTYFMLTDSGNPNGIWNNLRPITINNSSGYVTLGNGVRIEDNLKLDKALRGFDATDTIPYSMQQYSITLRAQQFNFGTTLGAVLIVVGSWSTSQTEQVSLYLLSWSGFLMEYSALNTIVQGQGTCTLTRNQDGTLTLNITGNGYNLISLF